LSIEQYFFGYLVSMLAVFQNTISMNKGIGKTGFLTGAIY
jgi:hypothetical protein